MTLDLNWSKCAKEAREAKEAEKFGIGMSLMIVGLSGITEKNFAEYLTRVMMWERVNGSFLNKGPDDFYITAEYARRWIGMEANVITESPTKFTKRLYESAASAIKSQLRRLEQRSPAEAAAEAADAELGVTVEPPKDPSNLEREESRR